MHLSKEILHSHSLDEVLESLKKTIETKGGLLPEDLIEEDLFFLYDLAFQLYQSSDYNSAIDVFKRLVIAKPFEVSYWKGYAGSLQMQKKFSEALLPWSMCCLIDPENPLFHYHAAECLFALGNSKEGKEALLAAETRDKTGLLKNKIEAFKLAWEGKS